MKEQHLTIEKVSQNLCVGCFAYSEVCPKRAITMIRDEKGFYYPQMNSEKCVLCGRCAASCQALNPYKNSNITPKSYAVSNKDSDVLRDSSSGGVFSALAYHIIHDLNGIVFGAAYEDGCKSVAHTYIDSLDDICALRGSKYVQSRMDNIFKKVEFFLNEGRTVLFSGTPCQIFALRLSLNCEYENLLTVDIICHGVPSPKMWEEHIQSIENKKHKQIVNYRCRSKVNGWHSHTEQAFFEDGSCDYSSRLVQKEKWLFNNNYNLRPSCYSCRFTSLHRTGDITIGDCWGIEKNNKSIDKNTGLSLVLINTLKGKMLFDAIYNICNVYSIDMSEDILQKPLLTPVIYPKDYLAFWDLYQNKGYLAVARKYGRYNFVSLIKDIIIKIDSRLPISLIGRFAK